MERSPAVFLDAARRAGDGGMVEAQGRPPCVIIVLRRRFEAERGGGGATAGYGGLHGRRGRGCACPAIGFCLRTMVQERQPVHELRPGGSPPGDPRFCADEYRKGGVASTALHGLSLSVGRDRDSTSVFFTVSNNLPFCRPPPRSERSCARAQRRPPRRFHTVAHVYSPRGR